MRHFVKLSELFKELGLPMNPDKICPPTRTITCLGITIDLDNNSFSIEKSKVEEIYAECLQVKSKTNLTRRKFQSLLGKLIYLHKCIKCARILINRILALFIMGQILGSSSVVFHCDNLGVVQVVASGKTKDKFLNTCIRSMWLLTAIFDIDLHIKNIEHL